MENSNSPESRENNPENKPTDTSEIVRRHLQDPNHQITDEDIRNVKVVGVEDGEPIITGAEAKARFDVDEHGEKEDTTDANDRPATPWDVVD